MFTTVREVQKLTGYEVTGELLSQAQGIVEVFIGRPEQDVENLRDKALLGRATAYQAAYMRDNREQVFEQAALSQVMQNSSTVMYKGGDFSAPWISPLAVIACKKLSWLRSRSIHTGRVFQKSFKGYFNKTSDVNWWND